MNNRPLVSKELLIPFILVTTMFFMWGLANNMTDTLLAAFKKIMSMTDFQTSWIQIAFYGSYFCLALPAALLIRKYEYKTGLLVGLGLFILGAFLFYPASKTMLYGHFLGALFVLAGGLSILETTANPYILDMGDPSSAIRRLNLAQSFNPIGSITGVVLSKYFILSQLNQAGETERATMSAQQLAQVQEQELSAVMGPYLGVAVVLLIIWLYMAFRTMPRGRDADQMPAVIKSLSRLFSNRNYITGVIAQFFYVGAQIGVWSFTIRYVMKELSIDESAASSYYLAALVVFTISRFGFTALMSRYNAATLMGGSAVVAMLLLCISIFSQGMVGVVALVLVSGCMSLMFPTIFGMASAGTGSDSKLAASGLIMAILGGAVLTPIQGQVSDISGSIKMSFFVPLFCFGIVALYSFMSRRTQLS